MSIISGRLGFRGRAHHSRCVGRAEQCDAAGAALGPGGRDYDEVHRVGGKASTQRTPEQTDIARLWITLGVPAWNPIARQLSSAKGLGVPHNARPFALFNLAGTDALIACWDSKSTHHGSHPVDAIRSGRRAGPCGRSDVGPAIPTPPFPGYVSGHACFRRGAGRARSRVRQRQIPEVSLCTPRRYTRLKDIVD